MYHSHSLPAPIWCTNESAVPVRTEITTRNFSQYGTGAVGAIDVVLSSFGIVSGIGVAVGVAIVASSLEEPASHERIQRMAEWMRLNRDLSGGTRVAVLQ